MFNPEDFMNTETTVQNETDYTPMPEGEYPAVISKLDSRMAGSTPVLDVTWMIDDQAVREQTGMDEPTCRQTIWLDVTESGGLEAGANKNVQLGKLREALGQNDGSPWSPQMLNGQPARVIVKHSSPNEQGAVYANVVQVAAA